MRKKTKKNPAVLQATVSQKKRREMPKHLWELALQFPFYDGAHVLVSDEIDDVYQDNNPNLLEDKAQEIGLEEYYIVNLGVKELIENMDINNWQIFETYPGWQAAEKTLRNFNGTLSDAVISNRGR